MVKRKIAKTKNREISKAKNKEKLRKKYGKIFAHDLKI